MPITGGVLVAGGAARCLYSATGMLRFLARLSGRRRHVRRNFGGAPGGATGGAVSQLSVEPSSSLSSSPLQPPLPPPLPPPPSSPSPSSSSSCCFTTSATTTLSTSLSSSNEANNNDNLENQLISDSIRDNKNNLDLNDIRLRQCYLRCRRNIHSVSCQDIIMDKLSTYTGKRLLNITSSSSTTTTTTATATATTTTSKISTTMTTMEEVEDDSLSRIAGLRDVSTTKMISRIQQRRCLEETDNNITRVSSSNINRTSCMSNSISSSGNCASTSSTRLKNDENSGSTGVARYRRRRKIPSYFATLIILSYTLFGIAEACSSRSTPKPRPPTPTPRPNITFHMDSCPPDYAEWYCLNGATCFTVKIQESLLYNCLCANGFIGQRCEFKDLDGSYLPSRQRVMLETASIAGGATIAVFLVVIMCISAYINCKRKQKELRTSSTCVDTVDGPVRDPERRPFSNRKRPIMTFMAKNSNCTPGMCPSIEQTRMPGWNDYSQVELTRLASINEAKRSSQ